MWVKVTSTTSNTKITVWIPPSRQGAITNVYRGVCLRPGCVFISDSDYLPEYRRRILRSFTPNGFVLGDWNYTYE